MPSIEQKVYSKQIDPQTSLVSRGHMSFNSFEYDVLFHLGALELDPRAVNV